MRLIWNEFERLKIKFHELVHNNNASFESISSQSDARSTPAWNRVGSSRSNGDSSDSNVGNDATESGKPTDTISDQKSSGAGLRFLTAPSASPSNPTICYLVTQAMLDRLLLLVSMDRYGR